MAYIPDTGGKVNGIRAGKQTFSGKTDQLIATYYQAKQCEDQA